MCRSICPPRSTARIRGIMRTKRRSISKRRCCTPPTYDAARSDARFGRSAEAGSTNPQLSSPRASAGMCGGIRAHVKMELVRKPESSRMRRKSVSKRKLIFQVPMVRIHFPPAESPQTFGSCSRRANSFHPRIPDAASGSRPDKVLKPFLSGAELRVRIHSPPA